MNVIGKWKLKGINMPTENGIVTYTAENMTDEYAEVFNESKDMILEFLEDGTLNSIIEAVGKYLEMAKEEGIEPREDGYLVVSTVKWEDRNGKIFYDCGAEGTILDEKIDPFIELSFTEDGCILYNFNMLLYERL